MDTRISKEFKLGERARLGLLSQFFDLTNRANFGNNYDGNLQDLGVANGFGQPQPGYITPSGVTVPHAFRAEFGAEFRF